MAHFIILVTSPHFESNSAYAASQFASAALDANHTVSLFFYGAGVTHANKFNIPQAGEPYSQVLWENLNKQQVELLVCATAAGRRGIMDDKEASQHAFKEGTLNPIFTLSGLTDLAAMTSQADRVVQF